jgi:hypothetical protein
MSLQGFTPMHFYYNVYFIFVLFMGGIIFLMEGMGVKVGMDMGLP